MGDVVKVYKVKNLKTGEYRTAGGGFSKTGKTWNNLGHLKSSLSNEGWHNTRRNLAPPSRDIVIIEIIVQETEGNTTVLADFIETQKRYRKLADKYGDSFSDLVQRIEKDGQQETWAWCLLIPLVYGKSADWEKSFLAELKKRKLKMGSDYRKANTKGLAVAFKSKEDAMMVRLTLPTDVQVISLDIQNFVEDES